MAIRTLLLFQLFFVLSFSRKEDDVLGTRELMCLDARRALIRKYDAINTAGSAQSECTDISSYSFPDMCVKPENEEDQTNTYLRAKEDDPDAEPDYISYNDDRQTGPNGVKDTKHNDKFKIKTGDYMGYKIQPQTEDKEPSKTEICASRGVGEQFKDHAVGESKWGELASTTSWQYFGGQKTGLFAQYPASVKTKCWCDSYDPRYRPWYAAAVTGPKDMVLVLDVSGSMKNEDRMEIMKAGAIAQLDTMTFLDYVQVVKYSAQAEAQGSTLLQATDENKAKIKKYIEDLEEGGETNGKAGLKLAFDILESSEDKGVSSGCLKIISFLTDGEMSGMRYDRDKPDDFIRWTDANGDTWIDREQLRLNKKAHIFTYALGEGVKSDSISDMKEIACNHQGWMARIKDGDTSGIKHAMIRYFEYFAGKIRSGTNSSKPRWSDFYQDSSGQGIMTTVSLPIFTLNSNNRRVFQGVIGIDVLKSDFGENLDDNELASKLKEKSATCIDFDFSLSFTDDYDSTLTNQCEIQERNPSGPMIPTGATHNEVGEGDCDGNLQWWVILLIVLGVLICMGLTICWARAMKKKSNGRQAAPKIQMVQARHSQPMVHYGVPGHGGQVKLQAHSGNVQLVQGQPLPMQPGQVPMQVHGVAQPMGMVQPPMGMMQQPMGMVQQPVGMVQHPMGMVQQPMGLVQQPIMVQQNTAANQQSQSFSK